MAINYNPQIVTDGLVLCLDAANKDSYPGTGTTWYDVSGNGYDFGISASAYATTGNISYMNFEGSYGAAKRVVGGSLTDVPNFTNGTIMTFTTIKNSTADWRTLTRGANVSTGDHQALIETASNRLGMFDNSSAQFIDSTFAITSLPNPYAQFNLLCWRLSQSSPYYQFSYNDNTTIYSITNANATFNNGFCVIGAYHNGTTTITDCQQYWGKISCFLYYNRSLSIQEIQQNYKTIRGRYNI